MLTSFRLPTMTRPGAGGISTRLGTATTTHPAAAGRLDAGRRVLDRHALHRIDAEAGGGEQVRLGVRLAVLDGVAGDDGLERDRRQRLDDGVGQPASRTS